jgi:hypothetical protein
VQEGPEIEWVKSDAPSADDSLSAELARSPEKHEAENRIYG